MNRQLTDKALTALDFHQFARILSALVPGFSGGALYDLGRSNLWTSAGFPESAAAEVELFLQEQQDALSSGVAGGLHPKHLSGNILLFAHTLSNHTGEPVATLILLIAPTPGVDVATLEEKMAVAIEAIAAILSEGHQLNSELNAMADELTTRYEELNLVYRTVDGASDFPAIRETLQQLVKNCAVSMDAPYSAMILLNKKISIDHVVDTLAIANKDVLEKQLYRLYLWTIKANRPLVLNDENDAAWDELKIKLPYKLLSYPVFDKAGSTLGVIVALKEKNAADFTNSDRNLLMVMANKTSKIIQSNYDSLTGLLNLDAFKYFLSNIHFSPSPFVPETHTVLYIDLDHMKVINETLGHQAGDEILRATGNLIKRLIRGKDVAARIGGDIFGVLLYNCPPGRGMTIAKRISSEIAKMKLMWDGKNVQLTACMGLATIDADSPHILSGLDDAEIACKTAKEEGKNKIRFYKFGEFDHSGLRNEMWWADLIQASLIKNDFILYCQKIHAFKIEYIPLCYEILLRAVGEEGEILEPNDFIPAAERYKLMPSVDRWVIINTLRLLKKYWETLQHKPAIWSINISGQSFRDDTFMDFIVSSVQNSAIPASSLCFEITETAAIGNLVAAQQFIKTLRDLGCNLALDDFGSGLSSFAYLQNLDIDYLKIDGSIVKDIAKSPVAKTMVKAIQDVAEALQVQTVGEFVETDAIAQQLSGLGVNYAQGYFYGRPLPLEDEIKNILGNKTPGKAGSAS